MLKYIIATKINIKGIELNNRIFFVSSKPSTTRNKPGNTINTIEKECTNSNKYWHFFIFCFYS